MRKCERDTARFPQRAEQKVCYIYKQIYVYHGLGGTRYSPVLGKEC